MRQRAKGNAILALSLFTASFAKFIESVYHIYKVGSEKLEAGIEDMVRYWTIRGDYTTCNCRLCVGIPAKSHCLSDAMLIIRRSYSAYNGFRNRALTSFVKVIILNVLLPFCQAIPHFIEIEFFQMLRNFLPS